MLRRSLTVEEERMRSRKFNLDLVRDDNPDNPESWVSFQIRKVMNLWLQIKKQYWNIIDK